MDPILAVFTFFQSITTVGVWMWNIGHVMRTLYAKGTRGRFIGQSLARPGIHLSLVHWVLVTIVYCLEGSYWLAGMGLVCVGLYGFIYVTIEKQYDDDDDFWKKTKKKLTRWVRTRRLAFGGRLAPV